MSKICFWDFVVYLCKVTDFLVSVMHKISANHIRFIRALFNVCCCLCSFSKILKAEKDFDIQWTWRSRVEHKNGIIFHILVIWWCKLWRNCILLYVAICIVQELFYGCRKNNENGKIKFIWSWDYWEIRLKMMLM